MATNEHDPMLPKMVGFRVSGRPPLGPEDARAFDTFELHRVALEHAHRLQSKGWRGVALHMVTLLPEVEGGAEHLEAMPLTLEKP